jgi:hypothetical protein
MKKIKLENMKVFRKLVKGFRVMKVDSTNGFNYLDEVQKKDRVSNMQRFARTALINGSFFFTERKYYINKIDKRIQEIYCRLSN